ncbi:hypothetical protein DIPPA_16978 [Diplonema papillatum]|nr:hypothetical protein DIPPA_16978 [Diplonema papillatum]
MFRKTTSRLCVANEAHRQKMVALFKIVTGEAAFKNKVPVKDCNVQAVFGPSYAADLQKWHSSAITGKMEPADKKVADDRLHSYLARLELTRYTARELATYMMNGAHNVAAAAEADMISKGAAFLKEQGEAAFTSHVQSEAKFANWSADQTSAFVKKVKAA